MYVSRFDLLAIIAAKSANSLDVQMGFLNWLLDKNELKSITHFRGVLSSHQKVVFRRQKRQIFDLKNSTYFTFYVGYSTRPRHRSA